MGNYGGKVKEGQSVSQGFIRDKFKKLYADRANAYGPSLLGLRWHDAWDCVCVCVCVSTVQPESWSCCLQMLIDGNRLRSGGVLVLFWLFFFVLFSSVVSRITRDGSRCMFWCAMRALLAASAAVWMI